jgi:Tol biopolymer transport system component
VAPRACGTALGLLAAALVACGANEPPAGAPPGTSVVFTAGLRGPYGIAAVSPGGGGPTRLSAPYRRTRRTDLGPVWSPDGTRIAFKAYLERDALSGGAAYHVHVMDPDGSGVRNLTRRHFWAVGDFDWAPDSQRLVVDVWNERLDRHRLHLIAANRGPPRLLTRGDDFGPRWSPDGSTIVFNRFTRGGASGLYAIAPDGTRLRRLAARGSGPAWSPDGSRLAYVSGYRPFTIRLTDPHGGARRRLATQPGEPGSLAWSPDGSAIAYDVYHPGHGRDIHLVETETGRRRRLTNERGDEVSPTWSPDGRSIAFEHSPLDGDVDNSGSYDVHLMSPDGGNRRRLTRCRCALGGGVSWQPAAAFP